VLSYWDPLWWLSGLVLAGIVGLMCWRIAPQELIDRARALLQASFGRLARRAN
jgi:hypothetical protein